MIHRGLRAMVLGTHGENAWREVERKGCVGPAEMISAMVYNDAITLALVAATAEVMGMEIEAFLAAFGRFWISFAKNGPYGQIMDFAGHDFVGFIASLDRMHDSVRQLMPDAVVPSFAVEARGEGWLKVSYSSSRSGLEAFVEGLLRGLLEKFDLTGDVRLDPAPGNKRLFLVSYRDRQPG